ncbi:hypothetical protein Q4520_04805 [Alteromonas sp. 1_MG-2023]|uniref:hypothetical protein n=1 Tax=Alteromonas sp. 1_MG-2023 TaxID=3062669 RepID=UPI0026E3F0BA|nr:hypothetical protein [Alteromonas sp. 1_MG-2023]MDO6474727.1 hypothetical protein [Alteromonas sp. 1_MG-2023]
MTQLFGRPGLVLLCCLGLTACAGREALPGSARNQFVTEFYAYVNNIHEVQFDSHVEENMAAGAIYGVVGTIGSHRNVVSAAIISGGLFGLLTAIMEGDRTGYEYSLHAIDGDNVAVIVEDRLAEVGQCVRVRVAGDVRMQPVDSGICADIDVYSTDYSE